MKKKQNHSLNMQGNSNNFPALPARDFFFFFLPEVPALKTVFSVNICKSNLPSSAMLKSFLGNEVVNMQLLQITLNVLFQKSWNIPFWFLFKKKKSEFEVTI